MNNLSRKRESDSYIQQIIDSTEKGTTMFLPVDAYYLIAKELKALREAGKEPVVYMWDSERKDIDAPGYYRPEHLVFAENSVKKWGGRVVPLYAAPQLPAVPDGWAVGAYSYDTLFNAIGKAVNIQGEALCISVKAFEEAMIAAAPKPE